MMSKQGGGPLMDFPKRFGQYLKEMGEVFEKQDMALDWPSTFMEDELSEFAKDMTLSKDKFGLATFHRASPRYEVLDHPDQFEVRIDVPGFKPEEIDIDLRAGGRILSISGSHEEKEKGRMMTSKFTQNFSLDPSIMTNELVADLKGEKIIVTAPRKVDRLPETRKIEMTVGGKKQLASAKKTTTAKASTKKMDTKHEGEKEGRVGP